MSRTPATAVTPGLVPWRLVPVTFGLLLAASAGGALGLDGLLRQVIGNGPDVTRVTAVVAIASNLVNNLPAYVALERVILGQLLPSLLLGIHAGPVITPWASLSTLLWAVRCRAAGVAVP